MAAEEAVRKERLLIAKTLKKNNPDIKAIISVTGLTEEEIPRL